MPPGEDAGVEQVRAAGGVVVEGADEVKRVLLVHRPRYDDWSFPKGKLDPGESFEAAALREVLEETGLACRLVRELSSIRYRDSKDRPKLVRYWLMEAVAGEVGAREPDGEIDEILWVAPELARLALSYSRDRELLHEVLRIFGGESA